MGTLNPGLPAWLQPDYDAVHFEAFNLTQAWLQHQQLFGDGELRRELLAESAGGLFARFGSALLKTIVLDLWKLDQPARKNGFEALSLDQLADVIRANDPAFPRWADLYSVRKEYRLSAKGFGDFRNQYLAHFDRDAFLSTTPFDVPTVEAIGEAIPLLHRYLNVVRSVYFDDSFCFDMSAEIGDGDALVEHLKRGLRYEELERAGKIPWDDLGGSHYGNA